MSRWPDLVGSNQHGDVLQHEVGVNDEGVGVLWKDTAGEVDHFGAGLEVGVLAQLTGTLVWIRQGHSLHDDRDELAHGGAGDGVHGVVFGEVEPEADDQTFCQGLVLRTTHQIWSLTQSYSVDFSQSRICVKKADFN